MKISLRYGDDFLFILPNIQCFLLHYGGCPEGYHSHQDDESGRCIPDSEKCEEGYIMAPDYPECQDSETVCKEFPNTIGCKPNDNDLIVTTNSTQERL
jgi:hypothetical protein